MAAVGFSLVALLTGWYIAIASRWCWLDIPNHRSSHVRPTPRAGGIPMVVVLLLSLLWLASISKVPHPVLWVLLVGGAPLALVSAWDDFSPINPKFRFCCQALACSLAVVVLLDGRWEVAPSVVIELGPFWWPVALLAALWVVNFFNFMDGIDGIAAMEGICLFAGLAFIHTFMRPHADGAPMLTTVVACIVGFVVWNWAPARVFMGDVGSVFIGYVFVVVSLWGISQAWWPVWVPVILSAAFWLDATITLFRRWLRGEKVYEAHRSHAYQRLARRWGSHQKVSLLFALVNVIWLLPLAWGAAFYEAWGFVFMMAAVIPLAFGFWRVGAGLNE